jgi:chromosome partitioning protein
MSTKVYAVGNEKGGVGKTTIAVNLAAAATVKGARVLLIDSDPTFRATQVLGVDPREAPGTLADIYLKRMEPAEAVTIAAGGVNVIASGPELSDVAAMLGRVSYAEFYLNTALADYLDDCPHDLVIIDTPPSKGLLLTNALQVVDEVLCVIDMTDDGSVQGIVNTRLHVRAMGAVPNARIPTLRALRNRVDHGRRVYRQIMDPDDLDLVGVCAQLGVTLMATEVPTTCAFANAATECRPLVTLPAKPSDAPLLAAGAALRALVDELGHEGENLAGEGIASEPQSRTSGANGSRLSTVAPSPVEAPAVVTS